MRLFFLLVLSLLLASACAVSKKSGKKDSQFDRLVSYMTGSFNSAAQAARDSDFYDITLHMYPIWKEREGTWLYVEQAVTANQAKPYRQRIYRLEKEGLTNFKSSVYTLKEPQRYTGAWQTPEKFDSLPLDEIELKDGCEVYLQVGALGQFTGSTGLKTCPSDLRGAAYATSKVTISKDKIVSWDQGFNEAGEQVWGAEKSGYEFVKLKN